MRNIFNCLLASLLVLVIQAGAQTNQQTVQKSSATATVEGDAPKNEVEIFLEQAKKRGESIFGVCLEKCQDSKTETCPGDFEVGRPVDLPQPAYPALARRAHVSGEVRVEVILDNDGKVIAAHAISGHPLLQATSVSAARNARFNPTLLDGKPVKIIGVLTYNFVSQ